MTDPTQSARILEAVALLKIHNAWRRGEDEDDGEHSPMPAYGVSPIELGNAIDDIVDLVPELIRKAEANPCTGR